MASMTTEMNIKLVIISTIRRYGLRHYCIPCPFVLSINSVWVILQKQYSGEKFVQNCWALYPLQPNLLISKLPSNKFCCSLRSCLLCLSVRRYLPLRWPLHIGQAGTCSKNNCQATQTWVEVFMDLTEWKRQETQPSVCPKHTAK